MLNNVQGIVLFFNPLLYLLYLFANHIPVDTNIPKLPISINTCDFPLAFCSTIRLPHVLVMI